MKLLIVMLTFISIEAYAKKCQRIIIVRVDNSFSKKEKTEIEKSATKWHFASLKRICFGIIYHNIYNDSTTYFSDNISTIYNVNSDWKKVVAQEQRCKYEKNKCMGVAISHNGNQLGADIFIIKRHKFYPLILHELGHLLGLPHSDNPNDTMFQEIKRNLIITERDKSVLRCLMKSNQVTDWTNRCSY
jgi:hypothetical protein